MVILILTHTCTFLDVDVAANALHCATQVQSLQFWAARSIISSKANYFLLDNISEAAKDYISNVYKMFNMCSACHTASLLHAQGTYFIIHCVILHYNMKDVFAGGFM